MRLVAAFAVLAFVRCVRRVSSLEANERQASPSLETLLLAVSPKVVSRALSSARVSEAHLSASSPSPARNPETNAASPFERLHSSNNELVKSISNLRAHLNECDRQIKAEKEEKKQIRNQIATLTDRLQQLDESLGEKSFQRNEFQKTIQETEATLSNIFKSSQDLVQRLRRGVVKPSSKTTDISSEETVEKSLPLQHNTTTNGGWMDKLSPKKSDTPSEETVAKTNGAKQALGKVKGKSLPPRSKPDPSKRKEPPSPAPPSKEIQEAFRLRAALEPLTNHFSD